jgi:hypothetical protein
MKISDLEIKLPTVKGLRDIQSEAVVRIKQAEAERKAQEKLEIEQATFDLVQSIIDNLPLKMTEAANAGFSQCDVIKIAIGSPQHIQRAGELLAKILTVNNFIVEWERDTSRGLQTMFASWERQKKTLNA